MIRKRKHPRRALAKDEWVPLLGAAWTIVQRQPKTDPLAATAAIDAVTTWRSFARVMSARVSEALEVLADAVVTAACYLMQTTIEGIADWAYQVTQAVELLTPGEAAPEA